jgi:hypothetical protein
MNSVPQPGRALAVGGSNGIKRRFVVPHLSFELVEGDGVTQTVADCGAGRGYSDNKHVIDLSQLIRVKQAEVPTGAATKP